MDFATLFLQRHDVLYDFWLGGLWELVPADLLRQRPHARVNSIAWNLWHLARVEDAGLNRFVFDLPQVLDVESWPARLHIPWRHHGSGMSFAEVDDLSKQIDLDALHGYTEAVRQRTRAQVRALSPDMLDAILDEFTVRRVLIDEGLAHSDVDGLIATYTGWNKGRALMNFGLTHPYQHVGEIGVIAGLLGVEF
ncbi:MAG: DinB family protein [Anaerolineae bacterium]